MARLFASWRIITENVGDAVVMHLKRLSGNSAFVILPSFVCSFSANLYILYCFMLYREIVK